MNKQPVLRTVEELIKELSFFRPTAEVDFSGLSFQRFNPHSDDLIICEFDHQIYRDSQGNVIIENL